MSATGSASAVPMPMSQQQQLQPQPHKDGTILEARLPPPAPGANRYPCCIVWSPLPLITLFLPFIGHLGIADSEGIIYDFAGPFTIGEEHMAFGNPTRFLQLDPARARRMRWDDGVRRGNAVYRERMHIICWDNCHNHAAECLTAMDYDGPKWWFGRYNMVVLCFWIFFCGSRPTVSGFLAQWGLWLVVAMFIVVRNYVLPLWH